MCRTHVPLWVLSWLLLLSVYVVLVIEGFFGRSAALGHPAATFFSLWLTFPHFVVGALALLS